MPKLETLCFTCWGGLGLVSGVGGGGGGVYAYKSSFYAVLSGTGSLQTLSVCPSCFLSGKYWDGRS